MCSCESIKSYITKMNPLTLSATILDIEKKSTKICNLLDKAKITTKRLELELKYL